MLSIPDCPAHHRGVAIASPVERIFHREFSGAQRQML
jgi:hypothetical protein